MLHDMMKISPAKEHSYHYGYNALSFSLICTSRSLSLSLSIIRICIYVSLSLLFSFFPCTKYVKLKNKKRREDKKGNGSILESCTRGMSRKTVVYRFIDRQCRLDSA